MNMAPGENKQISVDSVYRMRQIPVVAASVGRGSRACPHCPGRSAPTSAARAAESETPANNRNRGNSGNYNNTVKLCYVEVVGTRKNTST